MPLPTTEPRPSKSDHYPAQHWLSCISSTALASIPEYHNLLRASSSPGMSFKVFLMYRSQLYAFLFSSNSVKDPGASALQSLPQLGFAAAAAGSGVCLSSLLSALCQRAARSWGLISLGFKVVDKTKGSAEFFHQEALNFGFHSFLIVAINYFGN